MLDKEYINKLVNNEKEKIIINRRELHEIPETGLILPKTKAYLKEKLENMNIKYYETENVDGIYGLLEGKNKNKIICIRADMDALPIKEKTGLDFSSKNENMHACGHDGHMSILLTTLKILNEVKENLDGSIMFIFQPGEEGYLGAKKMMDSGLFENIKPDIIFSSHIGNIFEELDNSEFGIGYDKVMSSLDKFKLKISGSESHGAEPHKSRDPFIPTAEILLAVQSIISREINTNEKAVISFGKINGGSAANIIPADIEIEGTVRAVNEELRKYMDKRIGEIAYYISKAHNVSIEYDYTYGAPILENTNSLVKDFIACLDENLDDKKYKVLKNPTMIGEDFSYYLEEIPGFYYFFGSKKLTDNKYYSHHTEKFDIDEDNLFKVVYINLMYIIKYLNK
ncbi:MAG: amidohydrolase [Sebaldella sp.]|nr:amidohydrolase [Sebaldella sp.]